MTQYKIPFNPKQGMPETLKAFALIAGHDILPDVKIPPKPRQRRKQALPRVHPNRQLHRALVVRIVDFLRLYNWDAWIVEVSAAQVQGRYLKDKLRLKGMWDILAHKPGDPRKHWIEIKIPPDYLKPDQLLFGNMVKGTGDRVWVFKTFEEVFQIYDPMQNWPDCAPAS